MDYSRLLKDIESASPFDMYRLMVALENRLDDPQLIESIRRNLRPKMHIQFFDDRENRAIEGIVEKLERKTLTVRLKEDGSIWKIRYPMVNLSGVATDIQTGSQTGLDRNSLKVGDTVGFRNKQNNEVYAKVRRLNSKTATVQTGAGEEWRVSYTLLFQVHEVESELPGQTVLLGPSSGNY